MSAMKRSLLDVADVLSVEIKAMRSKLDRANSESDAKLLQGQISRMIERYNAIQQMPTWPVDATIRRRFAIANAANLLLPLVLKALESQAGQLIQHGGISSA
jgi:hypothetical protein